MLNHTNPAMADFGYDNVRNGVTLTARRDITRGVEVYDSYGLDIPNHKFFMNYGFICIPNERDEVSVLIELNEKDALL